MPGAGVSVLYLPRRAWIGSTRVRDGCERNDGEQVRGWIPYRDAEDQFRQNLASCDRLQPSARLQEPSAETQDVEKRPLSCGAWCQPDSNLTRTLPDNVSTQAIHADRCQSRGPFRAVADARDDQTWSGQELDRLRKTRNRSKMPISPLDAGAPPRTRRIVHWRRVRWRFNAK
jgi:hypothetical protein